MLIRAKKKVQTQIWKINNYYIDIASLRTTALFDLTLTISLTKQQYLLKTKNSCNGTAYSFSSLFISDVATYSQKDHKLFSTTYNLCCKKIIRKMRAYNVDEIDTWCLSHLIGLSKWCLISCDEFKIRFKIIQNLIENVKFEVIFGP